ncbi:type II secretion system F family protein [Paenibacillus tarimensis]|nr:hypothetical protein [Paenibacillus tarimensis]MCF2945933.1 hypothetical protein [Paenibacillus tarimensis]
MSWQVGAVAGVLFVLVFTAVRQLMLLFGEEGAHRERLAYRRRNGLRRRSADIAARLWLQDGHLSILLASVRWQVKPTVFLLMTGLFGLGGLAAGALLIQTPKGTLLLFLLALGTPYLVLRMVLTHRQLQSRADFLPAVELFYQSYMMTGGHHLRTALRRTVEERRLLGPMHAVFDQLYRNLSIKEDADSSLRIFASALGHVWGDYFASILRVGLSEGCRVGDNLKTLITDMRQSQLANQQERNRLLEIRLANFSPILFLALFIGINMHYTPDSAYQYYVLDPQGRDMILNALVLIFASFVMGIYLSRKKM